MIINSGNLAILFRAFNAAFQKGLTSAPSHWDKVATRTPSTTGTEDYGWLGQIPGMKEWLGDRQIQNIKQYDYSIKNKSFENTVGVPRESIQDDQYGVYTPLIQMLGQTSLQHRDQLIFALMQAGFTSPCYDKQYFFDTDHPVVQADGTVASVSNVQAGAGNPWFLLCTNQAIKPFILQVRKEPEFVSLVDNTDTNVFMRKEYLYGVDDRKNAGYGFWQMAFGSKADLDPVNFDEAYQAMLGFKGDHGRPLGLVPNLLVVGVSNIAAGRNLITRQFINGGENNINFNRVELMECPWLP